MAIGFITALVPWVVFCVVGKERKTRGQPYVAILSVLLNIPKHVLVIRLCKTLEPRHGTFGSSFLFWKERGEYTHERQKMLIWYITNTIFQRRWEEEWVNKSRRLIYTREWWLVILLRVSSRARHRRAQCEFRTSKTVDGHRLSVDVPVEWDCDRYGYIQNNLGKARNTTWRDKILILASSERLDRLKQTRGLDRGCSKNPETEDGHRFASDLF